MKLNDTNGLALPDAWGDQFVLEVLKASRIAGITGIHKYQRPKGSPLRIPIVHADSVDANYVPELGQIPSTEVAGTELRLLAADLMGIKTLAPISNESLIVKSEGEWGISQALIARVAKMLDEELIAGTGATVTIGGEDYKKIRGLILKAGVQDTDVGPLTIARLMAARAEIETANAIPGYILGHPKLFLSLYEQRTGADQSGDFLIDPVTGYGNPIAGFTPVSTPAAPWDDDTATGTAVAFAADAVAVAMEREEGQFAVSEHFMFDRDGLAIRVVQRADIGVINGPAVVRMEVGPAETP